MNASICPPSDPASVSRRPWRVLHLTATSAIGGTERMVLEIVRGSDPQRFEMAAASLGGPGLLTEACREAGRRAWNWGLERPWPWKAPRLLSWIRRMRDCQFDLIQTYGLRADLVGRLFKQGLGAPLLVCNIASVDAWRGAHKVWLDRRTAGAVDLFIASCEAARRSRIERERFDPGRIAAIYNGVELDPPGLASRPEARRALGLSQEDFPVVAHVANLRPMKGHSEALAAAARLLRDFPRAVFLFAGRDDSGGRYQRLAHDLGVAGRARFLGFHPRGREVARAADIAILPSYYEGCPVALLEAMAESRAIVATEVGGIPELVRHEREALLIPPGRPEALAAALSRLAADAALREALGCAARQRAEAQFTVQRMIRRHEEAYSELLERGTRTGER